jgi:general secretion pathway protein A
LYKDYFRFTELPFSIAPDPRFLYMSAQHREALAHLLYGVQGEGGFVLLTGEVGTGKTTLCRCLLEQIDDGCEVAYILNPKLNAAEMLAAVCGEFRITVAPGNTSIKVFVDVINAHLLEIHAQSRRAVLIIDEAQNLDADVLEQLRLLTNLETPARKLLQIILIGQPELQELLQRPQLRQVAQRIVARYHLQSLERRDTAAYVLHRLSAAGSLAPLFPRNVLARVHRFTGGVPRVINLVCDRALLGTFSQGKLRVSAATLRKAAREVLGEPVLPKAWYFVRWQVALLGLVGAGAVLAGLSSAKPDWLTGWIAAAPVTLAAPASPNPVPANAVTAKQPAPDWPDHGVAREQSAQVALHELLKRYGIVYEINDARTPCEKAESNKLRCLAARGSFADLQRINQPAVLVFDAPEAGVPFHAVLVALNNEAATLALGGSKHRIALSKIAPLWSGNYLVLWKPPPGYRGELAEGSRGEAVKWLRRSLAQARGGTEKGAALFDADLTRRVKAFQLAEGIEPDGIAGELTLTLLRARAIKDLPRLDDIAVKG